MDVLINYERLREGFEHQSVTIDTPQRKRPIPLLTIDDDDEFAELDDAVATDFDKVDEMSLLNKNIEDDQNLSNSEVCFFLKKKTEKLF